MIVDSSALVAIIMDEPDRDHFQKKLSKTGPFRMSMANELEAWMVIFSRKGDDGIRQLQELIVDSEIASVPFDSAQRFHAFEAFKRYGKGQHKAKLNFGDCIAYALAKSTNEPLLFKGDDFALTDIKSA